MARKKEMRFPVEPLFDHMPAIFFERHARAIIAWEKKGLTPFEADRICTRYGIHPFAVYGTYWYSDMWTKVA